MTPPSVERRYRTKPASFTWWLDDVLMDEQERLRNKQSAPDTDDWNQQMWTTRLFDQLIANADRNLTNLLIDKQWTIWMIDHSRAFRTNPAPAVPGNLSKVERRLLERLRALNADAPEDRRWATTSSRRRSRRSCSAAIASSSTSTRAAPIWCSIAGPGEAGLAAALE